MKKVNVKNEILIVLFITLVIVAISTRVFASSPIQIPTINTNTNSVDTNTTTNTAVTPTNTTTSPINVVPTTNTATTPATTNTAGSTYQNTSSLPQTGDASDYAIFALIAVSIVVAAYAYKKVRDYNI